MRSWRPSWNERRNRVGHSTIVDWSRFHIGTAHEGSSRNSGVILGVNSLRPSRASCIVVRDL